MYVYVFLYRIICNIYEHICWGSDNRQVPKQSPSYATFVDTQYPYKATWDSNLFKSSFFCSTSIKAQFNDARI